MPLGPLASILIPSLISGGAALAGGALRARGASRAAETQAVAAEQAAERASQMYGDIYQQQREDIAPWREAGEAALEELTDVTQPEMAQPFTREDFEADPGYQFRLEEGQKALERSAAARGGVLSGRAAKEAARFGQALGAQEYGAAFNRFQADRAARFNRLASLAGIGQAATGLQAQATGQYGAMAGPSAERGILESGVARAGGQAASGGIWGPAVSGIGSNLQGAMMMRDILDSFEPKRQRLNEGEISPGRYSFEPRFVRSTVPIEESSNRFANRTNMMGRRLQSLYGDRI